MNKLKEAAQRMVDAFAPHADMCRPCTVEWQNLREAIDQQKWVGLTNEEKKNEVEFFFRHSYVQDIDRLFLFVQTIEDKLKEKNT